jgi:hypothetical protein
LTEHALSDVRPSPLSPRLTRCPDRLPRA